MTQTCYNGVKLLGDGPDPDNVERLDLGHRPALVYMRQRGLQVDLSHFEKMEKLLTQDMERVTEEFRDATGYYINLGSGDQVADVLFNKLGIKPFKDKKTKGGTRFSVDHEALVAIQHEHPAVNLRLNYMEYDKLRGTYVVPMPKLAKKVKHGHYRMYPNLSDVMVPSGRCNCNEPNLLAMPNRTARGREICEGFITDPGWVYLSVDLSQIEPRTCAHLSQDPGLIKIYTTDQDIYSDFATSAFKLPDKRWECRGYEGYEVDPDKLRSIVCDNKEHLGHGWHYPTVDKKKHRFPAKTCILAWIYDVTASGLQEQMPIICANCEKEATKHDCGDFLALWTEEKCQDIINAAGMTYPGVIRDRLRYHNTAKRYGYVWDMWGRIIHATGTKSIHPWVQAQTLREIANFPYQSGARGPLKLASAKTYDEFEELGILGEYYHFLLDIHDEILGEVRESEAEEIGQQIVNNMENSVKFTIPIKASMATSENWGKLVK